MEPIKLIPLVSGRAEEWSNGCEQFAVHLTYDMSAVLGVWPDAAPSVAFERADGEKYAHEFIVAENILHIPLTLADTAVAGACKCVVTMISQDGMANSDVYHGRVTVGIDTLGEEPTDPQLGIIEQVNGAAIRAEIAAKDAEGTLEEVVSAGEAKKQEIADAGAEQIENIQSSEMVKDLIKDAISEHFEENAITAEAIGAASAEDLRSHEENKENPHHVTLQQLGGLPDTYVAPVASVNGKTDAVVLTADDVGALPATYEAPVSSVNGQTGDVELTADDVGAIPATGGTATGNIVVTSDTEARSFGCKVGSYDVRFMANTNGNRGLYDNVAGEWLLKKDSSNNVTLNGTATKASKIASSALLYANCGSWSGEIAASGYTSTLTITPTSRSGYTFLGPVSFSSSSSYFCCYGLIIVSGKVQLYGRNISSKAITPTVDITGVYIKN